MTEAQMTDPGSIATFMFAGKATFTLVSKKTGARYTYRITRKEGEWKGQPTLRHFVGVLTGSDNESSYSYLGFFRPESGYIHGGEKAKVQASAPSAQAFNWFQGAILSTGGAKALTQADFYHSGRCGRCGRQLTVPASIESGLGPECAGKFECAA
jgi:hypothetical protein